VDHLELFREYASLERKRCGDGVTPLEFLRWQDLDTRLGGQLRAKQQEGPSERRLHKRHKTRMRVDFETPDALGDAYIRDLSRGGLFISMPFGAEIGSELLLRLHVESTGEVHEVPGVVVSNNVSGGFSTQNVGMGVHFRPSNEAQRVALDELIEGLH
jgi:Tfp pilus assembly protein PilZ